MTPKRDRKVDPETGNKLVYGVEFYRISGMQCIACGEKGWWAHHVVPVARGGEDRGNLVPVCLHHHTEVHQIGQSTFEEKYGVDLEAKAKLLWQRKRKKWGPEIT